MALSKAQGHGTKKKIIIYIYIDIAANPKEVKKTETQWGVGLGGGRAPLLRKAGVRGHSPLKLKHIKSSENQTRNALKASTQY